MTIDPHDLPNLDVTSNDDIISFTTNIIKETEGFIGFIYDDGKGVPTIGYGVALLVFDGTQWRLRSQDQLNDIFDGIGHQLDSTDIALLQQAAAYLNGNKDPVTGVVTDNLGNVLINPFNLVKVSNPDPSLNVTNWIINDSDADQMIKNMFTSDPARPVTQSIDLIEGQDGLRNQLGQYSNGDYIWDIYKDSREGAALLSLWYNGQKKTIPTRKTDSNGNVIEGFLVDALFRDDRVAAWWEIRYGSNGDKSSGIAKRRYWESAIFSLYNDENNASGEAQNIIDYLLGTPQHPNGIGGVGGGVSSRLEQMIAYEQKYDKKLSRASIFNDYDIDSLNNPEYDQVWILDIFKPIAAQITETEMGTSLFNLISFAQPDGIVAWGMDLNNDNVFDGGNNSDLLIGVQSEDYTFNGGSGDDYLIGSDRKDIINGGSGDDVLFGGDDNNITAYNDDNTQDTLLGGDGNDVYLIGNTDIVSDSDGQGILYFLDGTEASNKVYTVSATSPNYYQNGDISLTLDLGGSAIIKNNQTSDIFTISNFQPGQFNITFNNTPVLPANLNLIAGDNLDNNITGTDANDEIQGYDGNDIINGGIGDDLIIAGTGNDTVNGDSGNDVIQLGDGNDDAVGGEGDDSIDGGAGDDYLFGGLGKDIISGGTGRDVLMSTDGNDVFLGGAGDDFISGGIDNDLLDGGDDNDYLAGGAGKDSLFGGAGDDVLWGDGTYTAVDRTWSVTVDKSTPHTVTVSVTNLFGELNSNNDQADLLDGGAGDDVLFGAGGNDQLYGGADNDFLIGGDGSDRLEGGTGNDNLFGDDGSDRTLIGNDILLGGAGNDFLEGGYGDDELDGGTGDDEIHGDYIDDPVNGGNDTITAGDGNDIVLAGAGDDVIDAGTGDDYVDGGQGSDTIHAGDGTDSVIAGEGNDTVFGDAGSDTLEGNAGDDILDGGDGNDVLFGNDGVDQLSGGAGLDSLLGGTGDDTLSGGDDSDQLAGGSGNDVMHGDGGDDTLFGEEGNDTLYGDAGNDRLQGGIGSDQLFGGDGSDILIGEADDDTLSGGAGNDELQGNDGNDVLQGEAGNDLLFGQAGDDVLDGGGGDDDLQGGDGTDFLYGGQGADTLTGGLGNDTYQFNRGDGADIVFDEGGALDVLSLGPNITAGDTSITTQGNDLTVTLLDSGLPTADTITLTNWFNADNQIESIQFNDGTVWDVAAIQSRLPEEIALVDGLNAQGSSNVTTYTFTPGTDNPDGFNITATDAGGLDALRFHQVTFTDPNTLQTYYATPSLTGYSQAGNDLVLDIAVDSQIGTIPGGSGQIRLQDYYTSTGFIETIAFPDGDLNDPNQAPVVATPAADQVAVLDTAFSYSLSSNTFNDSPFDVLTYSTSLADGSQLPAWLSFDATTLTFSGTPTSVDSAFLDIIVTAQDKGGLTAAAGFGLNVGNINLAPTVANPIEDQSVKAQEAYIFTLPADTFADRNTGDTLTYSAVLASGDPLPGWLSFDSQTGTFSGTPTDLDVDLLDLQVTATDSGGLSATDNFTLTVNPFNSAPVANPDFATLDVQPSGIERELFVSSGYIPDNEDTPVIEKLSDGGFFVVWDSVSSDGSGDDVIVGQRYDAAGNKTGVETVLRQRAGDNTILSQPAITELTDGTLVMVWTEDTDIYGQRLDGSGQAVGSAFLVSTNNANDQVSPRVEGLANGGFVVVWQSDDPATGDTSYSGVSAQLFDSAANKTGSEFLVNTTTLGGQGTPDVTATDTGFIVAWLGSPASLQQFDLNGNRVGNETTFGYASADSAYNPRIVELQDGGTIVLYRDSDFMELHADRFDAGGNYQESYFINADTGEGVFSYDAIPLDDGGFVVTYSLEYPSIDNTAGSGIYAAQFDSSRNVTTFKVSNENFGQRNPAITELADGSIVDVWSNYSIYTSQPSINGNLIPTTPSTFLIDVLANDTDIDAGDSPSSFVLTDATIVDGSGTVSIDQNKIRFDVDTDIVNSLDAGHVAQVSIDYTMADDGGDTSSSTLTLLIQGQNTVLDVSLAEGAALQKGGTIVSGAGDINGDGFSDFAVFDSSSNTVHTVFGQSETIMGPVDLAAVASDTTPAGYTMQGSADAITSIHTAGDVNGDGVDDFIVGAPSSDPINPGTGKSYVVFGNSAGITSDVSLDSLDGTNGFVISGQTEGDQLGASVSSVGDVNGDGIDDIILGIPGAVNGTTGTNGEAAVIFGRADFSNAAFDLQSLDGSNGFLISGMDSIGSTVSNAGDVNGDGFDDIIVGAPTAVDPFSGVDTGSAYIIYGSDQNFGSLLDVRNLDGTNGFTFSGLASGENIGNIISAAGDINGDGYDDVLIGNNSKYFVNNNSEGYVIFGEPFRFFSQLNQILMTADGHGKSFQIPGSVSSLSSAGDVNGDGFDDFLAGVAEDGTSDAGSTYLIFGQGGAPSIPNPYSLDVTEGFRLTGVNSGDLSGSSVSGIGDVNSDGFDDILIGAPGTNAGEGGGYIVYGRDFNREATYTGTSGDDIVNVVNDGNLFTLSGNDIVQVDNVQDVTIYAGAGNDTVNLNGVDNAIVNTGPGSNTLNISGSPSSGTSRTTINSSWGGTNHVSVTTTIGDRAIVAQAGLFGGGGQVYDVYTGQVVDPSDITLRKGSMIVDILDGQVELHFEGVDTDNLINGPVPFEKININNTLSLTYDSLLAQGFDIDGTNGDDVLDGTEVTDRINGLGGDDVLDGGKGDDTLTGGTGADTLRGGSGGDTLNGGGGDDVLQGGDGDDTYLYRAGDGSDTVTDTGGVDQVVFGDGISADTLSVEQVDNDLVIGLSATDQLVVTDWFSDPSQQVERFVFTNDNLTINTADEMEGLIGSANQPPIVNAGIADQTTDEDAPFSFTVPADAFTDPDAGDILTYNASTASGGSLPNWLAFDADTRTFSGTPDNNDVGAFDIAVTATDPTGESATDTFQVVVNNVNDAPMLANPLPDQAVDQDAQFSFTIPEDTFQDDDAIHGDTQTFSVALADGSVLPAWLQFDQLTHTLSGTPANADVGMNDIRVTVTDSGGLTANDVFTLTVNDVNDPPMVNVGIEDQATDEDANYSFTIPSDTFSDADMGDTLSYSASLANGGLLPSWLTFDSDTQTFSGIPTNDDVGSIDIRVTATDTTGTQAADIFSLTVNNVNDAPELAQPVSDQTTTIDTPFSLAVPAGTFTDDDIIYGDQLTLSATLANGDSLPDWLVFDPDTGVFSGTPAFFDYGDVTVRLTATDLAGASVNNDFGISVKAPGAVIGTESDETLVGTNQDDVLLGLGGNDVIKGKNSNDRLAGGDGNDDMDGGNGDDILYGQVGDDLLNGGNQNDILDGGLGADVINGGNGDDNLYGQEGNDTLSGGNQNDLLDAGSGNDILNGGNGEDILLGGDGNDILNGGNQSDILDGGSGDDILDGGEGGDQLIGGAGNDQLTGSDQADVMDGGDGNDILIGNNGTDTLLGGSGDDQITGGEQADHIEGGDGNDVIIGNNGTDTLLGGAGDDQITGGNQADFIEGGDGNDIMEGGQGNDVYQLNANYGMDSILDTGGSDTANFTNVSHDQLWLWREGNDLRIGVIGTQDWLTVNDWYVDQQKQIETFNSTDDGYQLLDNQVQQLVDAMAIFDVQSAGDLNVPQEDIDGVQSVIAAAWTST